MEKGNTQDHFLVDREDLLKVLFPKFSKSNRIIETYVQCRLQEYTDIINEVVVNIKQFQYKFTVNTEIPIFEKQYPLNRAQQWSLRKFWRHFSSNV